jgi:hypothetical protein
MLIKNCFVVTNPVDINGAATLSITTLNIMTTSITIKMQESAKSYLAHQLPYQYGYAEFCLWNHYTNVKTFDKFP